MNKLEQLIYELCPDGVKYTTIGKLLKNNNALDSVSKKDYKEVGEFPIIDQSQAYIAAYTNKESALPPILPCIIFGDHTRVVKYADRKFAQGDSGTKVFIPVSDDLYAKYIYYALCNLNIPSRGYNRHWSIVKDIQIPIPPLPIQKEIVRILDNFTELTTELTTKLTGELKARKKQYEYYRDKLLTFNDDVEYKTLSDLGIFYGGLTGKSKGDFSDGNEKFVSYMNVYSNIELKIDIDDLVKIDKNEKQNVIQYGDIIFTGSSETPNECGMSSVLIKKTNEKLYLNSFCFGFRFNNNTLLLPDFSKYLFRSNGVRKQIVKTASGVTRFNVSKTKMGKVRIPLPMIEDQERIVAILDRFDILCNDISKGLPAEIEARRKQYEYYRDKLLTFKELEA